MIKGSIQQEDVTLVNTDVHTIGAPNYVNQILMNIKDRLTVIQILYKKFKTALTIDIVRAFHPKAANYTFFHVHIKYFPG